jgi:hypothetical protein
MSAGNAPSAVGLNNQAGLLAVTLRNTFCALDYLNTEIAFINQSNGLQTVLGMDAPDAAVLVAGVGNLEQLSQIYQGLTNLNAAVNYKALTVGLWGNQ